MLVRHVLSQLSYAPFVSLLRCSPQRRGSLYTFVPVLSTPFFRKNPSFFRRTFCVPKLSVRLTCFPENVILDAYGELSEWFKEPVLKTGDGETHREFESHTLRQKETAMLVSQSPIRMFLAGIRCNPTIGVAPFSLFQAVSLYSCGFALILAIRLLISSSVGMSISPIAVK